MPLISTRIEIEAPPEVVRAQFLDFKSLPNYHQGHFVWIGPKVEGAPLNVGERLSVELVGMKFNPTSLENSPSTFGWRGSPLLFTGDHFFRFSPCQMPSTTTFIHEENFYGFLTFIIGENWGVDWLGMREKTGERFEEFNLDFRGFVERRD